MVDLDVLDIELHEVAALPGDQKRPPAMRPATWLASA